VSNKNSSSSLFISW